MLMDMLCLNDLGYFTMKDKQKTTAINSSYTTYNNNKLEVQNEKIICFNYSFINFA